VIVQYGSPFRFEPVEHSTREQQQAAAVCILERIKAMHGEMTRLGARGSARALRARRAAAR